MTFGDNYSPQNFEPVAVVCSQQATYLWDNKPEEYLEKFRQYIDAMVLDPNKWDARPFAQVNPDTLNMGVLDGNGNRLPPDFTTHVDNHL